MKTTNRAALLLQAANAEQNARKSLRLGDYADYAEWIAVRDFAYATAKRV